MKRQKKVMSKSRPDLTASPTRARMANYWYVMREDWYLPWVARPPEAPRRQRSLSLHSVPAHSLDAGTPCPAHHLPPPQHPPPPPPLYAHLPNSSIHMRARSFDDGHGHMGHISDLQDPYAHTQIQQQHYLRFRGSKSKGSQRISVSSSRGQSLGNNSNDDYGFLPHPRVPLNFEQANTGPEDVGSGSPAFYSKERISSISDCDEEDELHDDDHEEDNERRHSIQRHCSTSSASCKSTPTTPDAQSASKGFGYRTGSTSSGSKRPSKLKRRKAYYRDKKEGRSRSLTHIDNLDPAMLLRNEDMDSRSEPDTSHDQLLYVPAPAETRETRRKKLARSQVSSSEFFSVCFEGELGSGLEEFLPATRGTCLGDALRPLFDKKNISFTTVNVFVDSSKTPLPAPASTDTYFVAGKNLIVRAKEHDPKFHSRSFKQPSRKPSSRSKGKFFSSSTEDPSYTGLQVGTPPGTSTLPHPANLDPSSTHGLSNHLHHPPLAANSTTGSISHEGSLKVKNTKQSNRWSGLFSNSYKDNSKMDLLVEQLNSYSKNGIPTLTLLNSDSDEVQSNYALEEDWKSIVQGWSELSERGRQQQTAIWELVETEVVYLRTVKVITDLFLSCLYNLQANNILNEIDREQLFSNIPEIYKSNKTLWLDCILPMVQKARSSKQPLQPSELRTGFLRFGATCQAYIRYCLDQTKCQQYCREKYQDNELFKAYLAWCETRKECNRLRLMDILVRPMQRMTKYSLLLKAILKHTEDPEQRKCVEEMILSVERFVKSVNGALRSRQDAERLQGIAERIEAYDVVETREDELEAVVKSHSKLDLFHPMPGCGSTRRWFLFESDLKIKDSFTSKMDAHCFLFTDMLLVCKPMGRKGEKMKVIRQPYAVDRLLVRELSKDPGAFGLVFLNEYGTASAALTFHSSEPKLVKVWIEHIKKAQKLYAEAKHKESLEYPGEILDEDEASGVIYLTSRSPRGGSSRASQLSSLVHSHSGSVEMNEVSTISSRAISFEHELRGSSLSSDDGNGIEQSGVSLIKGRSLSTETGPGRPTSPRLERRVFMSKSPTPNTLSVQIPVPNLSGQSLPNLTSASDSSPPAYSIHSLVVPKSLLSPTHRGISYPPPSPRNLRRSHALLQSRNPPLQKAKNILSPEKCTSLDVHVPEFRGVTPPSNDTSPVTLPPPPPTPCSSNSRHSPEVRRKEFFHDLSPSPGEDDVQIVHSNPDQEPEPGNSNAVIGKRLARNERADAKRYYTAGAIEDIKKENNKDKDSSIHKRLSWNYGPQQQQSGGQGPMTADALKNRQFFSSESMTSIRSSSGVSSTSSLLHCISDLETTHEYPEGRRGGGPTEGQHPGVRIDVIEPEESEENAPPTGRAVDTTDLIDLRDRDHSNHISGAHPVPPPPHSQGHGGLVEAQNIHVSAHPPQAQQSPAVPPRKPDSNKQHQPTESSTVKKEELIMKDFILTDSSIQASEV